MNPIIPFLMLSFVFVPAISQASFICPDSNVIYKGVTCCTEQVSLNRCKEIIDTQIPAAIIEDIRWVQEKYEKGRYTYGRVPNCFWNALNFMGHFDKGIHRNVEPYEFVSVLVESGFNYKTFDGTKAPQILSIQIQAKERDDILENNLPKRVWRPFSETAHAMIYLGNGIIFQKENIGRDVFSIDLLEHSVQAYEKAYIRNPKYREVNGLVEAWYE